MVKGAGAESLRDKLGGELAVVDKRTAQQYGVEGGVQVKSIGNGLLKTTRMQQDFVISSIDGKPVRNIEELTSILSKAKNTVRLEGFYPGFEGSYAYPLNLNAKNAPGNGGLQEP